MNFLVSMPSTFLFNKLSVELFEAFSVSKVLNVFNQDTSVFPRTGIFLYNP